MGHRGGQGLGPGALEERTASGSPPSPCFLSRVSQSNPQRQQSPEQRGDGGSGVCREPETEGLEEITAFQRNRFQLFPSVKYQQAYVFLPSANLHRSSAEGGAQRGSAAFWGLPAKGDGEEEAGTSGQRAGSRSLQRAPSLPAATPDPSAGGQGGFSCPLLRWRAGLDPLHSPRCTQSSQRSTHPLPTPV